MMKIDSTTKILLCDGSSRNGIAARFLKGLAQSRFGLLIAIWLYAYTIHFAHTVYLNPRWGYYGFTYRVIGFPEFF